jgi:hypothetical protein
MIPKAERFAWLGKQGIASMAGRSKSKDKPIPKAEYIAEQTKEESRLWKQIAHDADKAVARIGRPSKRTQATEDEILVRLANGQSLAAICRLDHMPDCATVIRWTAEESKEGKAFCVAYNRARASQADVLFDESLSICDDDSKDLIIAEDGSATANPSAVARSKLRIETRFRMAGKISQKYADKPFIGDNAAITINNNSLSIDGHSMAQDQRDSLRAILLAAKDARTIDD